MNNSFLVSVILPVYNAEKYVAQCIENLLYQTYKNIEIVLVDDGSTDNTAKIAQQYPIKYIYQPNKGVYAARNVGLDTATGDYVHFMDVDDLLSLAFYEKMVESVVDTQADVACCGFVFERYPSRNQIIEHKTVVSTIEDKLVVTNVCNYGACWKYIFKLSYLKENKLYFEIGRAAFDRIFSLQAVYYANKIVSVPDAVYIYKNRKDSITTSKQIERIKKRHKDRKYAVEFQENFAKQHNFSLNKSINQQNWQYKLLGLPLFSKRIYHPGKIRWYFLGIPLYQKKESGK